MRSCCKSEDCDGGLLKERYKLCKRSELPWPRVRSRPLPLCCARLLLIFIKPRHKGTAEAHVLSCSARDAHPSPVRGVPGFEDELGTAAISGKAAPQPCNGCQHAPVFSGLQHRIQAGTRAGALPCGAPCIAAGRLLAHFSCSWVALTLHFPYHLPVTPLDCCRLSHLP